MKRADQAFNHHHYKEAIDLYHQAIRRDLDNDKAITRLAIAYWKTNQLLQAEYWFTRAALMNEDPEVKLMFARVLLANEKHGLAATWLEKYMAIQPDDEKLHHARQLHAWARGLEAGAALAQDLRITPAPINSPDLDFAPVLAGDKLFFTTNRIGVSRRDGTYDPWTGSRFTEVWMAQRTGENSFNAPTRAANIPSTPFHDGPLAFSKNGDELFISTSDIDERTRRYDANNNTHVQIRHYTLNADQTWKRAPKLPFLSTEYTTTHPALSHDGRVLVFASDRRGSLGGMDLFMVSRDASGHWSNATPLPKHINTRANEVFPYLHQNGDLYFASDGHPGFGGMDLFRCAWNGTEWGLPENLGRPINGPRDDFAIAFDDDGNSGFFSSNRNHDTGDDILFFKRTVGVRVDGQLVDCSLNRPIANAMVELVGDLHYRDVTFTDADGSFNFIVAQERSYTISANHDRFIADDACRGTVVCSTFGLTNGQRTTVMLALSPINPSNSTPAFVCGKVEHALYASPVSQAEITLESAEGETIAITTNHLGTFFAQVDPDTEYTMTVTKAAFFGSRQTFTIASRADQCHSVVAPLAPDHNSPPPPLPEEVHIEKDLVLELYHVYFDFGSAILRQDAMQDLETFYRMLVKYPGLSGEIMAHTDARGDDEANLMLSQRRADAVQHYLTERGIDATRLSTKGYGKTRPVNHCADGVECTEEQHRRNRRVEFKIIDTGDEVNARP